MGDDPCECFFSHTAMMQRLLRMLQDAQDACTDGECTDGMLNDADTGGVGTATVVAAWMAFAAGLYLLRPNTMRAQPAAPTDKPGDGDGGGPGPEPPAPTA
eukprot:m.48587 g.48587  ORF g.48587 m.48587 type:complete len:101 (-) comp7008_c0_seq1:414-716(-)